MEKLLCPFGLARLDAAGRLIQGAHHAIGNLFGKTAHPFGASHDPVAVGVKSRPKVGKGGSVLLGQARDRRRPGVDDQCPLAEQLPEPFAQLVQEALRQAVSRGAGLEESDK